MLDGLGAGADGALGGALRRAGRGAVGLLQRGGRAVVSGMADGQPAGGHGGHHDPGERVRERRVRRVLAAVRHRGRLGARRRRVEERVGQFAHVHGLLQGPLGVGLEHYFEQGL